jgi:hypothetical protein
MTTSMSFWQKQRTLLSNLLINYYLPKLTSAPPIRPITIGENLDASPKKLVKLKPA